MADIPTNQLFKNTLEDISIQTIAREVTVYGSQYLTEQHYSHADECLSSNPTFKIQGQILI